MNTAHARSGLMRLQELLKSPTQTDIKIVVRQLNFLDGNRYCRVNSVRKFVGKQKIRLFDSVQVNF